MLTLNVHDNQCCGTCIKWGGLRVHDGGAWYTNFGARMHGHCEDGMRKEPPEVGDVCAKWEPAPFEQMNCWEAMMCGFEPGGRNAVKHGRICPAWPDNGATCHKVNGVLCALVTAAPTAGISRLVDLNIPEPRCRSCHFRDVQVGD
jgi:hypothetical protein